MNRQAFVRGLRAGIPVTIGYLPMAVAFGIVARAAGIGMAEATGMSVFVFAGASQYMAADLVASGVHPASIVLATLVLNFRHFLMSTHLGRRLRPGPAASLAVGFVVTDETYVVGSLEPDLDPGFFLGLGARRLAGLGDRHGDRRRRGRGHPRVPRARHVGDAVRHVHRPARARGRDAGGSGASWPCSGRSWRGRGRGSFPCLGPGLADRRGDDRRVGGRDRAARRGRGPGVSWYVIAGMMLVTWVPRFVPLLLSRDVPLPRWIRRWLSGFPYAALGALIFPGILGAIPDAPLVAVGAGLVALLVALKAKSPVIPVLAAIAAAALLDLVL